MRQLYIGNPRLDYMNESLTEPVLFAPAAEVKALTFAWFYGAGERKLGEIALWGSSLGTGYSTTFTTD